MVNQSHELSCKKAQDSQRLKVMSWIPQSLKQFPPQGNKNKNSCLFVLESPFGPGRSACEQPSHCSPSSILTAVQHLTRHRKPGFSISISDQPTLCLLKIHYFSRVSEKRSSASGQQSLESSTATTLSSGTLEICQGCSHCFFFFFQFFDTGYHKITQAGHRVVGSNHPFWEARTAGICHWAAMLLVSILRDNSYSLPKGLFLPGPILRTYSIY